MNELQLSKDLNVITAEIQSYKQIAGQSIFEIGRRLNHVKENDLSHGEFGKWLESIEIERSFATRVMKVSNELGDSNYATWNNLSQRALYEIATLPQEEREKEHVTSKGETKTVDEMTVRELQEVKRKLRETEQAKQQAESQAEQARQSEEIARKQLEEMEDKEPQVIEKEVVPVHVSEEIEQLKRNVEASKRAFESAEKELESYRLRDTVDFDEEQAEKELKKLQWEAERSVYRLINKLDDFMKEVAIFGFMEGEIAASTSATKKRLSESIEQMKSFTRQMDKSLKGRIEL